MIDLQPLPRRDILCIDCKCFFASIECVKRKLHPLTTYLCVVSRAGSQNGLILAATPKVKQQYRLFTGARVSTIPPNARQRILIVPPNMALYLKVNGLVNDIFKKYVAPQDWHPYSIDESFIDVTHSRNLFGTAEEIAHAIQKEVWERYKLPLCIGIGDNPLLAKLALDNEAKDRKPYIATWRYNDITTTVWRIHPLTKMWGIGHRSAKKLNQIGIFTVQQLATTNVEQLKRTLGASGEEMYYHANGIDLSILSQKHIPKEQSFMINQILPYDYHDIQQIRTIIYEMAEQLAARLRKYNNVTTCIHLSITYAHQHTQYMKGSYFAHQMKIVATNQRSALQQHFFELFQRWYDFSTPIRTISVSCNRKPPLAYQQLDLFTNQVTTIKAQAIDEMVDKIRKRYGFKSLIYASSITQGATSIQRSNLIGGHQA